MSSSSDKNKRLPDYNDKSAIGSKTKVSSYTQVDQQFVGAEFRSIVGQEDLDENVSTRLQGLQEQNKGIRPPLVGQASSSSNDSVSLSFDRGGDSESNNEVSPPHQAGYLEPFSDFNVDTNEISYGRGNHYMLNREDYINQKPPEGSSDQISAIIQPIENVQDFNRLQSPSSASSVTSGPPLQWDSLADVGYNQNFTIGGKSSDAGISTLERMALVCGTNLLTRSDPEGTTGPSRQPQPITFKSSLQSKFKKKNKLGYPKAESTPMGTSATSDMSPETASEDQISPITYDSGVEKLAAGENIYSSSSDNDKDKSKPLSMSGVDNNQSPLSQSTHKSPKTKVPLFPEIINSIHSEAKQITDRPNNLDLYDSNPNTYAEQCKKGSNETSFHSESESDPPIINNNKNKSPTFYKLNFQNQFEDPEKNSNSTSLSKSKKLSSSLENISTYNIEPADDKSCSNTLPRSQSQLSVHADSLENKNTIGNAPKYTMALHSLVLNNKSASSSSIATVVHRKGDSPKHVFAQTSVLKNESVGVQVGGDNNVGFSSKLPSKMIFDETPRLPKSAPMQQLFVKRSNYFNFNSTENRHELGKVVDSMEVLKSPEKSQIKVSCGSVHSHDGVPCTGAHKKTHCNQVSLKENIKAPKENRQRSSIDNGGNFYSNNDVNSNQYTANVSYFRNEDHKSHFGTNTIDSVESSAKSGSCWTDKQYSMAAEDRVNSFEYLPGHVYENTERQQPIPDSRGTSSISIQNQTSNNETPDGGVKLWDDSASVSSTLDKDVQRGVELFSEFVKGSCANDSVLKKKLIERVVERIITKNYSKDKVGPADLTSNVPWVPSRAPNPAERNGRETRRSVNRSKVPCEFSSRSEKSGSTNASSDCFIPCPAASSTVLPSSLRDSSCMPGKNNHSSTSEISVEKASKNHSKPPHALDVKAHIIPNGSISKDATDISSSKASHRGNWKEALTKSEKLLEEKKTSQCREGSDTQSDELSLVRFLNMERENQLFWIRSEIQHLSNLKELLEKQENLKQCVKDLKLRQRAGKDNVLRDGNVHRTNREQVETRSTQSSGPRKTSLKSHSKYQPTLSAWLEKTVGEDYKVNTTVSSAISSDLGMEDWTSHHYRDENNENVRSCLKRKSKSRSQKGDKYKIPTEERNGRALYDEPPCTPMRKQEKENKYSKLPSTPYPAKSNKADDPFFVTEKGVSKKNAQTETLNTVGVQTTDSVQQLPVVHPNWFRQAHREMGDRCGHACACVSGCRCNCCGDRASRRKSQDEAEKPKAAVGYYVTFEPSPREREKPTGARPLEEVRIPVPVSEPKSKPSRRPMSRLECRERETQSQGMESRRTASENAEANCRLPQDNCRLPQANCRLPQDNCRLPQDNCRLPQDNCRLPQDTDSGSSGSENSQQLRDRPIYNGCVGTLQYYLLRNHPSYVSRAEDRRQCIAQMQYLRELRDQSKRRLLTLTEPQPAAQAPQPPLAYKRVFSQQTMRRQTEKKYRQLAEVRGKQQDTKRKEGYRTNRLMAEIFNKKLQRRVLMGEVNLSNSVSVISSL